MAVSVARHCGWCNSAWRDYLFDNRLGECLAHDESSLENKTEDVYWADIMQLRRMERRDGCVAGQAKFNIGQRLAATANLRLRARSMTWVPYQQGVGNSKRSTSCKT